MTEAQAYERRRWIGLALLCVAQFVVVLDASIVNVALPTIGSALDFSQDDLSWVVNAYVAHLRRLPAPGRADGGPARAPARVHRRPDPLRRSPRSPAGSRTAGRAGRGPRRAGPRRRDPLPRGALDRHHHVPGRCRAQQGAGRLGRGRGLRRRGGRAAGRRAHAVRWAGSGCCGSTCRSASAPRCWRRGCCREPLRVQDARLRLRRRGDRHRRALGARLRAGRGARRRLGLGQTIGLLAAAVVLLARSSSIERRSAAPLVPVLDLPPAALTGANVVGLLTGASLFSMFFFISLYMQNVLGYSAIKAGLSYLPLAVTIIIAAGVASQLVTRSASSRCSRSACS